MRIDKLKIDKYFHLYSRKNDVVFEEVEKLEQRAKGEWTDDNACPFCGFQPWYERDIHTLSFCPNCGADMRGENDDIPDDIPMEYFENGGI